MTDKPIYIGLHTKQPIIELPPQKPSPQWGTFDQAIILPSADAGLAIRIGQGHSPTNEERREHSRRAYGRKRRT